MGLEEKIEELEEVIKHDEQMLRAADNFLNTLIFVAAALCILGFVGYFILR